GQGRQARRRVQHGGRGGGELCQRPRTAALREAMGDIKALILHEADGKVTARVERVAESALPPGEVTVAVEYSTLNYKDGLILNGLGRLVRKYPHVPGVDFAGTVEASDSPDYKRGDKVILTGWRVGEMQW